MSRQKPRRPKTPNQTPQLHPYGGTWRGWWVTCRAAPAIRAVGPLILLASDAIQSHSDLSEPPNPQNTDLRFGDGPDGRRQIASTATMAVNQQDVVVAPISSMEPNDGRTSLRRLSVLGAEHRLSAEAGG
jgi:hypothetical protein